MLFDALAEAFRVLGGVPRRGIFDNMRTAVDGVGVGVGVGKAWQVNARFAAMASHYLAISASPRVRRCLRSRASRMPSAPSRWSCA